MPYGTARNRLNKLIMFSLMKEVGKDVCFQCGEKIDDIDHLSIEHKTPWLHSENASELFFDLDNIAFSHLSCNVKASRFVPNITVDHKKGKSGYRGVQVNRSSTGKDYKWRAVIQYKGKGVHIAYGNDPKKLAKLYDKKAIELLGEDAITNKSLGLL